MELSRFFSMSEVAFLLIKKVEGRQVTANSQTVMGWKAEVLKSAVDEWQRQRLRQKWHVHDNDPKSITVVNQQANKELQLVFLD